MMERQGTGHGHGLRSGPGHTAGWSNVIGLLTMLMIISIVTPPPVAGATPLLAPSAPLSLDATTAAAGQTVTVTATYRNTTRGPVWAHTMLIAADTPNGQRIYFNPSLKTVTIPASSEQAVTASYIIPGDAQPGAWRVFSSWRDGTDRWHESNSATLMVDATPQTPRAAHKNPIPALEDGIYWGTFHLTVPWDMTIQDQFESRVGKGASIIHWGQAWKINGQYQRFDTPNYQRVRDRGSIPMLSWGAHDLCCGPDQGQFRLAEIYSGAHDEFIRQWATDAKAWGHPLFLRFNWEMNGWWATPWQEALNNNGKGDYVKAWRHVHDIFTEVGATNVAWVWSPNIIDWNPYPVEGFYPGDAYVDWVAMDGYNWGLDQRTGWRSFEEVFALTYAKLRWLAPGKPIMIAETGSSEDGGNKAAWIRDAFGRSLPNDFRDIKAVVWWNWNSGETRLEWPIESSQESIDAFATMVGRSNYYASNQFHNLGR